MSSTRLILVRHGETEANRTLRHIGSSDLALNETGHAQARELATALAPLPIAAIYSSPLQRAYQTATAIAERHQLPVQLTEGLREGNFGSWELLTRSEIIERSPQDADALQRWEHDATLTPPDGESLEDIHRRTLAVIETLAATHPQQTIVLVSHVGPIKAALCAALGSPVLSAFRLFLDPATISVIDWKPRGPLVRLINGHTHLGWQQARWMS